MRFFGKFARSSPCKNCPVCRASGASDKPYPKGQAVPFQSPPSLEVEVHLPNRGAVKGMGIGPGVSLIVGGGFHGKSTLLKALEAGVTDKVHLPALTLSLAACQRQ